MSRWGNSNVRRILDCCLALGVLTVTGIPVLILAAAVKVSSPGPAFFCQGRVGRHGRMFKVIKLRTMAQRKRKDSGLTSEGDARVTPLGRFLRRFKLDELPQFVNVLKGDMSIVGPRPKLREFAAIPNMPYRPGITGLASIAFRFEEQMLGEVAPERVEVFYRERIKPLKANLDVCYMCHATPSSDCRMVLATVASCVWPPLVPRALGDLPPIPALLGFNAAQSEQSSGD